jgi:hypothetical protein
VVNRRLSTQVGKRQPATQTRTALVIDLLEPTLAEDDETAGWQVLLDFGGGEVRRAGVAASYIPAPGDTVAVARHLNTLFVIGRVTAGENGDPPGGRVGFAYRDHQGAGGTYLSTSGGVEAVITDLLVPCVLKTGTAYEVEMCTGFTTNTANQYTHFRLRQDTLAGAAITEFFRHPMTVISVIYGFHDTVLIRNDTGVDITTTLVPTFQHPGAITVSLYASTVTKPFMEVRSKGSSKLYPHAAPMPVPADFTG